ncbi:MAG: N4-gp56 family major capsid protein [Butyricicoccus pullicaecorum]
MYEGEIGKIENVRFVETSEAKVFEGAGAEGCDVYATLILGDNAYGTTEIEGGGLTLIVKQLGSGGASDPLDQRASVAWKATKAAVRLQEAYMVRIETTSTFTGE